MNQIIPDESSEVNQELVEGSEEDIEEDVQRVEALFPTPEQLKLIQNYSGLAGLPPLDQDDVFVVPFVAANNLINRSFQRWPSKELSKMVSLLPGNPLMFDHDWDSVKAIKGKIFDAKIVKSQPPKDYLDAGAGTNNQNAEYNRKIIAEEGYVEAIAYVYFNAEYSELLEDIYMGTLNNTSVGGYEFSDFFCPLTNTSFDDPSCNYLIPDPSWGILPGQVYETGMGDQMTVAPYADRVGLSDIGELSIVTIPRNHKAQVKRV